MTPLMIFLRSTLFNIAFFGVTALMCVACLPGLLLPRRQALMIVTLFVRSVYFFEKNIAGINYEIRGREHLPAAGPYIVAAKHQSAYETMKLHVLFRDPAVILKKELLKIPLWGWFLAKSDPIAIDRSQGREAIAQIIDGARRVGAEGRPIIIFPQGTRVRIDQTTADKPYKIGVARLREATNLPVIPMALNAGYFWPKHRWIKKPGTVIFEFLPPVPAGLSVQETIKDIENRLEYASAALLAEATGKKSR